MSDKDDVNPRARALLDELREKTKPLLDAMHEGSRQMYMAAAQLAGDPVTEENEVFWQITGNLFTSGLGPDPRGPEVAALVNLSKAVATASSYEAWSATRGICDRLFDEMDGGQELGLSDDFLDVNWHNELERHAALIKGMQFHRVPRPFQEACAEVVSKLMLASKSRWDVSEQKPLSQPWAEACTYVAYAVAERIPAPVMH